MNVLAVSGRQRPRNRPRRRGARVVRAWTYFVSRVRAASDLRQPPDQSQHSSCHIFQPMQGDTMLLARAPRPLPWSWRTGVVRHVGHDTVLVDPRSLGDSQI